MTCDQKDRHVLAAAVRSDAAALVTFNLGDFPHSSDVQPGIFMASWNELPCSIRIFRGATATGATVPGQAG